MDDRCRTVNAEILDAMIEKLVRKKAEDYYGRCDRHPGRLVCPVCECCPICEQERHHECVFVRAVTASGRCRICYHPGAVDGVCYDCMRACPGCDNPRPPDKKTCGRSDHGRNALAEAEGEG